MTTTRQLSRFRRLIDSANAGHYTLPEQVTRHITALDRLNAATLPPMGAEGPAHHQLVDNMVAAALAGKPLPDATGVLDARRADERAAAMVQAHTQAVDRTAQGIGATITDMAEQILVDHLRPALAETVDAGRALVAALGGAQLDPVELLRADAKARNAYFAVDDQVVRYDAIRTAQDVLRPLAGPPQVDTDLMFTELKNYTEVFPLHAQRHRTPERPWPTERKQRFMWLVDPAHGAELWMPTPAEQDARHRAEFPPQDRPALSWTSANAA